jgi:hypothetical protein
MRRHAILSMTKGQRPHPRRTYWGSVNLEDAADHSAIAKHVEIIVTPLTG